MSSLPFRARVYVTLVVAVAVVLLGLVAELPRAGERQLFVVLSAAAILASTFERRSSMKGNRAAMSASFVVDFASLLLLGPHKTMLIAAAGAIAQSTLRTPQRRALHRIVFNAAALVVTVEAAGAVYHLTGGVLAPLRWPQDATAVIAAVTTFFLVDSGTVAGIRALATRQPFGRVWRENFFWSGAGYFVGAALSVMIAEIGATRLWDFLPLTAVPIFVSYRAYRAFAGRLEEEHRHNEIIKALHDGMAVVRRDGRIALWNDALERMTGVPRERAMGRKLAEAVPELDNTMLLQAISAVLESGRTEQIEQIVIQRPDQRLVLEVRVFLSMDGVTVFWHDTTDRAEAAADRAEAAAARRQSEERYALAAAGSNDGLWDWDLVSDEIYLSPRWHEMLGLPPDDVCRPDAWFERMHPDDREAFTTALNAHLGDETRHFEHEHGVRHQDGTYRRVLCRGVAVRDTGGRATRIAGSQTDMTGRADIQEQLRHAALHDALTGLPNRTLFMELLAQVIQRSRRHPQHLFAVLFLDVDRFKLVNDSLGHLIGDELLIGISRRLEACMRQGDAIARLGGDEFTILLNDLGNVSQATAITERILETLRDPFAIKEREVFVTASVGMALSGSGYRKPEEIMRDADTAMYRAKALGKARCELFDSSMHARAVERLRLEGDLRRAIERGEFVLHYQPIVAMKSGHWTGFEALIRWECGGQEILPGEFIPIVEEMGLIESLGTWVIQEACAQVARWRVQFPNAPAIGVAVNVSARQLSRPDFVFIVRDAVYAAKLRAGDLRVEITETTLMENPEGAELVLRQLRALGVKVSLDDFGTGFSSLSYLHRFPVDTLKIDRSFIASLSGANQQPAFVESIIALAKALGTHVIAEGVETEAQRNALLRLGCTEAQGFFFARPLSARVVEQYLAQRSVADPATAVTPGRGRDPLLAITR